MQNLKLTSPSSHAASRLCIVSVSKFQHSVDHILLHIYGLMLIPCIITEILQLLFSSQHKTVKSSKITEKLKIVASSKNVPMTTQHATDF